MLSTSLIHCLEQFIGRIRFIKSDALIFGPNKSGEYIYLYKNRSGARLYVVENYVESLILNIKQSL